MAIPYQKNFYDHKRYFQGKDNPGDWHPEPEVKSGIPIGQVVAGVIFFAFIGFLAFLSIRSAKKELEPEAPPAAAAPAAEHH
jgi:hypothetical protein